MDESILLCFRFYFISFLNFNYDLCWDYGCLMLFPFMFWRLSLVVEILPYFRSLYISQQYIYPHSPILLLLNSYSSSFTFSSPRLFLLLYFLSNIIVYKYIYLLSFYLKKKIMMIYRFYCHLCLFIQCDLFLTFRTWHVGHLFTVFWIYGYVKLMYLLSHWICGFLFMFMVYQENLCFHQGWLKKYMTYTKIQREREIEKKKKLRKLFFERDDLYKLKRVWIVEMWG